MSSSVRDRPAASWPTGSPRIPSTRVVLIEAGGRDWHPMIHIPAGYMKLLDHPTLTWGFKADADSGLNGREIPYPRGRVLGGSSSINGMIYIRGQPEDFDHWAQLGNRGWSWDDVLPFFRKAENWEGARPTRCMPRAARCSPHQPATIRCCARRRSRPASRWAGRFART